MSEKSLKILQKNTCVHKENKCNHLHPFSMIELQEKKNFTKDEKDLSLKKYKMGCKNQAGVYSNCCDKNDKNLEALAKRMKLPKLKGNVEYDRYGKLNSVKVCKDDKCKGSSKLTAYEMCKIGEDYLNREEEGEIKKFNPDCFLTQCNPQEQIPDILGTGVGNYTYELDKNVSQSIEKNNISMIKYYIQKDPSLKTRVLTHNQDGNTIYHETLKYNSGNNLYYIFKQATKDMAYRQNLNGDTILHMAMCINTPNPIIFCLKLGCDINEKNNKGETPIFCAIRNNLINNVRIAINNIANLDIVNKEGDTPLLASIRLKTKNVDMVRLLVERGSDINTKDKEAKTSLQIVNSVKNPKVEDEEVRTYLERVTLQNMGIKVGEKKDLSKEETDSLEGIVYNLDNKNLLSGDNTKFKISLDYTGEGDKYYHDDLNENYMQPYKPGDKNLSHEPYFQKFKNLQKDKLEILKKTVLLTKWDNKNSKNKKLAIIDDIMEDKREFDSYKYEVMNDNGISIEQEHMIFKDHSPNPETSIKLKVYGKEQIPYDLEWSGIPSESILDQEIEENTFDNLPITPPSVSTLPNIEEEIIRNFSPVVSEVIEDKTIFELVGNYMSDYSVTFLFLAIVLTVAIIFSIYHKSQMKGGFSIKKFR
jgi:hypothetical protein